jgi:hypothetical protein
MKNYRLAVDENGSPFYCLPSPDSYDLLTLAVRLSMIAMAVL